MSPDLWILQGASGLHRTSSHGPGPRVCPTHGWREEDRGLPHALNPQHRVGIPFLFFYAKCQSDVSNCLGVFSFSLQILWLEVLFWNKIWIAFVSYEMFVFVFMSLLLKGRDFCVIKNDSAPEKRLPILHLLNFSFKIINGLKKWQKIFYSQIDNVYLILLNIFFIK